MLTRRTCLRWVVAGAGGLSGLLAVIPAFAADSRPRVLVLPWLVVDRVANRECTRGAPTPAANAEALRLSRSAGAALDAGLHRGKRIDLIPAREWKAHWDAGTAASLYRMGEGCAVCSAPSELLRFDRAALLALAQSAGADHVWLGLTVVPLSTEGKKSRPDACCWEALGTGRSQVLARSSAVLVRASDGEIVWQRDARRREGDVPARIGKVSRSRSRRVEMAVDGTAHRLAEAFSRDYPASIR